MEDGHLDDEMTSLIAINHNFHRLIFSNACNIIYFNTSEYHILNNFLSDFQSWKHAKDVERRNFFFASSPATTSRHVDPVQVVPVSKIGPDPLTEAEKREILKKQENEESEKKLKRQLQEMNEQEKKNKDLTKKTFVEKRSSNKKILIFLCEKTVCNFQYKSYSNLFYFPII